MTRTASRCRRYAWVLAVLAIRAEASDSRWTVTVTPPRPSLPAVTVVLGEPGYVSKTNTPIELNAVGSSGAFDGYIGYRLEVGGKRTLDNPIVARAALAPHQQWTFKTWLQLFEPNWTGKSPQRELVVEWRDRSMRLIDKKPAGTPPWSAAAPLQIVRDGESAPACCFGVAAQVRHPADLADVAQWYSGFAHLVINTDLWLDLPLQIREAAVSSGLHRSFIGAARPGQQMSELDRAVIPVEFLPAAGETTVPWPYAQKKATIRSAVSWRAKPGTVVAGTESSPYLVDDGWSVFLADAVALATPLPSTRRVAKLPFAAEQPHVDRNFGDLIRFDLVRIVAFAVVLLTLVFSVMVVRSVRVVAIFGAVGIAIALLACRDQLRVRSLTHTRDEWRPQGLGTMRHETETFQYGPTPIGEHLMQSEDRRLAVTSVGPQVRQEAELRGNATPPGHGVMFMSAADREWDSTSRLARKTEVGVPVKVTIRERKHDTMTFDYEAPFPVDCARARWISNGMVHSGDGRLGGSKRGTATVQNMSFLKALHHEVSPFSSISRDEVTLAAVSDERTAAITWTDPATAFTASHWQIYGELKPDAQGIGHWLLVLPRFSPDAAVSVGIESLGVKTITATFAGINIPLQKDPMLLGNRRRLDPALVKRIATEGGILSIAIELNEGGDILTAPWVTLDVKEKKP